MSRTCYFIIYSDIQWIMSEMVSQITSLTFFFYLIVCSCADQRKHQRSTSLAFVRGIHRWSVNSRLNKRLSKQSWCRWFETPSHSLWPHSNGVLIHSGAATMVRIPLQWRHNERNGVSNHRRLDCSLNRLFRRRSERTSKLCVTALCEGNPPVTGGFPSQRVRNGKNASSWGRHHAEI